MAVSSFQKLLEPAFSCSEYFLDPISSGKKSWPDACSHSASFRAYLKTLVIDVDPAQLVNAYLLTRPEIESLFSQSVADKDKCAIRIYLGKENVMGGWVIKLYTVLCEYDESTKKYEDFHLPITCPNETNDPQGFQQLPELGEARPCPDNCSSSNFMNQP